MAMIMHALAKNQGPRSDGSKDRVEMDGRTDTIDRITFRGRYSKGDSDVVLSISMPAGFRRHLVGRNLRNVCYSGRSADIKYALLGR